MLFRYHDRLEGDARRWVEKGLVDEATAERLLDESRSQTRGYSFTSIVVLLGVVCLCFAAMTFVAANWEDMPKLVRVGLIMTGLWAAYAMAVAARVKGHPAIANSFVVLGCGLFGAGIMLIGQMYHLQGRPVDAVLMWAAGSIAAAFLLRSAAALWLSIVLITLWFYLSDLQTWELGVKTAEVNYAYLGLWGLCAGLALWLRSRLSAHLLAIGMIIWLFVTVAILRERHDTLSYVFALYGAFFVVIAAALASLDRGGLLHGFEPAVVAYAIICIGLMTAVWIIGEDEILRERSPYWSSSLVAMGLMILPALVLLGAAVTQGWRSTYDIAFCAIWIAVALFTVSSIGIEVPYLADAYALALSVWVIRMGLRQGMNTVTRLGYAAFAGVMLIIYFRTTGTLLGTSGFYLTAGLLMVLGALFLPRLMQFGRTTPGAAP